MNKKPKLILGTQGLRSQVRGAPFPEMGESLGGAGGKEKSSDGQESSLGPAKSEIPMRQSCLAGHWIPSLEFRGQVPAREIHFRVSDMWSLCKAMRSM